MSETRPGNVIELPPQPRGLDERTDDELLLLASEGHRAAFERLARRWLPRLTSFAGKWLGDLRAGEEVAQEVLMSVWSARHDYRPAGRFAGFVFTIARNRCKNHVRGSGRRGRWEVPASADVPEPGEHAPNQLDALLERERRRRVHAAVAELAPKLREVLLLRVEQGLTYPDIAAIIGENENTVRSRMRLAVERLRRHLEEGG
jgi:RNA polymerase sigma-70 factor (ECF subfamily)